MSVAALKGRVGDVLEVHEAVDVDGLTVHATAQPADADGISLLLRYASELGMAAIPCGSRTQIAFGNLPQRADFLLSTQRLRGVDDFDPGEGVCHVAAGTRLDVLREEVEAHGWRVPLDLPGPCTVGGALATGLTGPRAHGMGLPRDAVLGLEVVHASGTRTRCGARVVKNVTGYDLAKLYTGSLGTLGVLTAAWLRLQPAPTAERALEIPVAFADAVRVALEVSGAASLQACVLATTPQGPRLWVELAGDAPGVEARARALIREYAAREVELAEFEEVARRQHACEERELRFRLAIPPRQLTSAWALLARAGARLLAHPGLSLIYAWFGVDSAESAFVQVAEVAGEGQWWCEVAPSRLKQGRDVFGDMGSRLPLVRALKHSFDADAVLNPGRFAGRI